MDHQKVMTSGVITESYAKVLVLNEKNEALILTIGEYKAHPEKSFTPDLPGGQVEIVNGESEKVAAIRETEEEAGVVLRPEDVYLAFCETNFYEDENKSVSGFLYIARLDHTPDVAISWEHCDYEWIPIAEVLERKSFRRFLKLSIDYAITHTLL